MGLAERILRFSVTTLPPRQDDFDRVWWLTPGVLRGLTSRGQAPLCAGHSTNVEVSHGRV